jgi:hypothetical protein
LQRPEAGPLKKLEHKSELHAGGAGKIHDEIDQFFSKSFKESHSWSPEPCRTKSRSERDFIGKSDSSKASACQDAAEAGPSTEKLVLQACSLPVGDDELQGTDEWMPESNEDMQPKMASSSEEDEPAFQASMSNSEEHEIQNEQEDEEAESSCQLPLELLQMDESEPGSEDEESVEGHEDKADEMVRIQSLRCSFFVRGRIDGEKLV